MKFQCIKNVYRIKILFKAIYTIIVMGGPAVSHSPGAQWGLNAALLVLSLYFIISLSQLVLGKGLDITVRLSVKLIWNDMYYENCLQQILFAHKPFNDANVIKKLIRQSLGQCICREVVNVWQTCKCAKPLFKANGHKRNVCQLSC